MKDDAYIFWIEFSSLILYSSFFRFIPGHFLLGARSAFCLPLREGCLPLGRFFFPKRLAASFTSFSARFGPRQVLILNSLSAMSSQATKKCSISWTSLL